MFSCIFLFFPPRMASNFLEILHLYYWCMFIDEQNASIKQTWCLNLPFQIPQPALHKKQQACLVLESLQFSHFKPRAESPKDQPISASQTFLLSSTCNAHSFFQSKRTVRKGKCHRRTVWWKIKTPAQHLDCIPGTTVKIRTTISL